MRRMNVGSLAAHRAHREMRHVLVAGKAVERLAGDGARRGRLDRDYGGPVRPLQATPGDHRHGGQGEQCDCEPPLSHAAILGLERALVKRPSGPWRCRILQYLRRRRHDGSSVSAPGSCFACVPSSAPLHLHQCSLPVGQIHQAHIHSGRPRECRRARDRRRFRQPGVTTFRRRPCRPRRHPAPRLRQDRAGHAARLVHTTLFTGMSGTSAPPPTPTVG